jgi:hypothetical protein
VINLIQAQADLTQLLASSEQLQLVNVKSYRALRLQQEIDWRKLVTTVRAGRSGAGVLVLMPTASEKNASVTGPVLDWNFPVIVMELDLLNQHPAKGTLIPAETLGQIVMDIVHLDSDDGLGTFQVTGKAMEPEKEFVFKGVVGYRVNFILSAGKTTQTPRVAALQMSVASGEMTITTATADARVKYTLDGTFPADDTGGNPASYNYAAPFAVASGDVVRAAGYKSGMNKSATRRFVVP